MKFVCKKCGKESMLGPRHLCKSKCKEKEDNIVCVASCGFMQKIPMHCKKQMEWVSE